MEELITKDEFLRKVYSSEKIQNYRFALNSKRPSMDFIRLVYDEIDKAIADILSKVTEDNIKENPISIKLFDGVKISSYYKPPIDTLPNFYKKNDKDLDINNFKSKVGVKVDFTRYYRDKLTNLNWEFRGTDS